MTHTTRRAFCAFLALLGALFASTITVAAAALVQAPPEPSTLELWIAAQAIITTAISAMLLQLPDSMHPWAKRGVVAVISGVVAAVAIGYQGRLDTSDWGRTWIVVFLAATALYVTLWRPISDKLKGLPQT